MVLVSELVVLERRLSLCVALRCPTPPYPSSLGVTSSPPHRGSPQVYAFFDRLLSSVHRVSDPAAADYFFVPAIGPRMLRRHTAMQYVRDTWFVPTPKTSAYPNRRDTV